jgi:hypothetical protein
MRSRNDTRHDPIWISVAIRRECPGVPLVISELDLKLCYHTGVYACHNAVTH